MPEITTLPVTTLSDAVAALADVGSMEEVGVILRTATRRLVGADGVCVVVRDGKLVRYIDEDAISPLWKGQAFPIAQCISGLAIIGRQTIVIDDIMADPRVPHDLYAATFVKSMAMAPVGRADPMAAIGCYWAKVRTPARDEIAMLEAMAEAAAAAFIMAAQRAA